jgi:hypothetical protein
MNIVIVIGLLVVLSALAAAGYFMVRGGGNTPEDGDPSHAQRRRMARALTVRIAVSVMILLAWSMGWINPSGLPAGK